MPEYVSSDMSSTSHVSSSMAHLPNVSSSMAHLPLSDMSSTSHPLKHATSNSMGPVGYSGQPQPINTRAVPVEVPATQGVPVCVPEDVPGGLPENGAAHAALGGIVGLTVYM